jgi:hypothetical protein
LSNGEPTTDRFLIPLPDGRWLALKRDALQAALTEGASVIQPSIEADESQVPAIRRLLTANEIGALTNLDASWFLSRARLNEIPHVRLGKYVRFDPATVLAHLARGTDTRTADPHSARIPLSTQARPGPVSKEVSNSRSDRRCRKRVATSAPETAPYPETER